MSCRPRHVLDSARRRVLAPRRRSSAVNRAGHEWRLRNGLPRCRGLGAADADVQGLDGRRFRGGGQMLWIRWRVVLKRWCGRNQPVRAPSSATRFSTPCARISGLSLFSSRSTIFRFIGLGEFKGQYAGRGLRSPYRQAKSPRPEADQPELSRPRLTKRKSVFQPFLR